MKRLVIFLVVVGFIFVGANLTFGEPKSNKKDTCKGGKVENSKDTSKTKKNGSQDKRSEEKRAAPEQKDKEKKGFESEEEEAKRKTKDRGAKLLHTWASKIGASIDVAWTTVTLVVFFKKLGVAGGYAAKQSGKKLYGAAKEKVKKKLVKLIMEALAVLKITNAVHGAAKGMRDNKNWKDIVKDELGLKGYQVLIDNVAASLQLSGIKKLQAMGNFIDNVNRNTKNVAKDTLKGAKEVPDEVEKTAKKIKKEYDKGGIVAAGKKWWSMTKDGLGVATDYWSKKIFGNDD